MTVIRYNTSGHQSFEIGDGVTLSVGPTESGWLGTVICEGDTYATRRHTDLEFVIGGLTTYLARVSFEPGDVRLPVDVRKTAMLWARNATYIKEA